MKKIFTSLALMAIFTGAFAQNWDWVRSDYSRPVPFKSQIAYSQTGHVYVSFDNSIVKYTNTGEFVWMKTIFNVSITGISCNGDREILITGLFTDRADFEPHTIVSKGLTDLFVAKYSSEGVALWAFSAGSKGNDFSSGISVDPDGNILITGGFEQSLMMGNHPLANVAGSADQSMFVSKLNPDGHVLWARQSSGGKGFGRKIKTDSTGSAYVLAEVALPASFNGLMVTDDGFNGNNDILAKYDINGRLLWAKNLGNIMYFPRQEMSNDKSRFVYLSHDDRFLTSHIEKYNDEGKLIWRKQVGLSDYMMNTQSLHFSSSGYLYAAGHFGFEAKFCNEILPEGVFILKWDKDGNCIWNHHVASETITGDGLVTGSLSDLYITGRFDGNVEIGNDVFETSLMNNLYVARINESIPAGVEDHLSEEELHVYPNPAENILYITFKSKEAGDNLSIEIKNATGQTVYSKRFTSFNGGLEESIDLGNHARGIYLVEILTDKRQYVKRVVLN